MDNLDSQSESDGLQQKIKALIVGGEFEMGEKLSEEQLAKRFGTGKAAVRHALGGLAAVGLIVVRPRIGSFIFSVDVEEFDQLNTLREVLECAAVRIAMQANCRDFLRDMQENIERAAALTLREDYHQKYRMLDREFHLIPFCYAKNKYLKNAYETVEIKIWTMRSLLTFPDSHYQASFDAHRSTVELLCKGHVDEACDRLQMHIRKSFSAREKNLLRSFER